jgi:[protein-PII] uridylyltransferase
VVERLRARAGDEVPLQAVRAHVAMVSDRYLATTSVERMAEHLTMLRRLEERPVVTELFHHPDLGSSDLVVVARDVPGLFSLIAGTLAAHRINIISAQIHTRADGIAIDTLQVSDPAGEPVTSATHWARVLDALRAVITGERSVEELLESRGRARGEAPAAAAGPPKVVIDNQLSDTATVIEVKCPDRVGLLYLITATLAGLGLDIASARIATEIDKALDTFYVSEGKGQKVETPEAIERIGVALREALARPL